MADDLSDRKDLAASSPAGSSAGSQAGDEAELQRQEGYPAWTGKRKWYRSTFTQITILGVVSFLGECTEGTCGGGGRRGERVPTPPPLLHATREAHMLRCLAISSAKAEKQCRGHDLVF